MNCRKTLRTEVYTVDRIKRIYIQKKDHSLRPLGIPTVGDRVVQQAVKLITEPILNLISRALVTGTGQEDRIKEHPEKSTNI